METTGIVKKIDDLGRIAIPKEIRRAAGWKKTTSVEIFIGDEGEIVLKKFTLKDRL